MGLKVLLIAVASPTCDAQTIRPKAAIKIANNFLVFIFITLSKK
jgi:hypothetical protein